MASSGGRLSAYSPDEQADAVQLAIDYGCGEASRQTGIDRSTIWSWCTKAGVDMAKVTENRLKVARSTLEGRLAKSLESRGRIIEGLQTVTELAIKRQIERLRDDPEDMRLYDIVGAGTRAIHDLQLLAGEATERQQRMEADPTERAELLMATLTELARRRGYLTDGEAAEVKAIDASSQAAPALPPDSTA